MTTRVSRRVALCMLLFALAFLRAEQGVAEIQGRGGEPSRILRLWTNGDGVWEVAFLGFAYRLDARILVYSSDRPLLETEKALPTW